MPKESLGRQLFDRLWRPVGQHNGPEIARLLGTSPQRIGNWRSGYSNPDGRARDLIQAHWPHIRVATWDAPPSDVVPDAPLPTARRKSTAPPSEYVPPDPRPVPELPSDRTIAHMAPGDMADLTAQLRAYAAELSARDAWRCIEAAGRLEMAAEKAKLSAQSDREKYLASPEARQHAAELYRLMGPEFAPALRTAFGGLTGIDLPSADEPAGTLTADLILARLRSAEELAGIGEHLLSAAELIPLQLDDRRDEIASLLADAPGDVALAVTGLLAKLAPQESARIARALEVRRALREIKPTNRPVVINLLRLIDQPVLAQELQKL